MSAVPWLIGGAALGVGVLLVRNRAAGTDEKPDAGASICAAAAKLGVPAAACEASLGVLQVFNDLLSGPDWAARDAENKRLNGEVELVLADELRKASIGYNQIANQQPALKGTVIRFKNGAVPFRGFPGWEKCAPGTHSMILKAQDNGPLVLAPWDGKGDAWYVWSGEWASSALRASLAFSGKPMDPFTRKVASGYYVAGVKLPPCPAGKVIEPAMLRSVVDGATGKRTTQARCGAPGASYQQVWGGGPANTSSPTGTATFGQYTDGPHQQVNVGGTGTPSSPPPGYHWVPATPTVPGHWERDMAPR